MIEFRNVSKTFSRKGRDIVALDTISLRVDKGDIFGIIGYSGAGKSTLLRLINRLESPSQGEVLVNGESLQNVSGQRLNAVKKDIGMIFQNFNLLNSKTVFHNIAIPLILQGRDKAFIQARVSELLEFVSLSDKAHSYPNELSGGQKQRVGIARALATNPSVLLCDEATSALDPHTTVQILLLLQEINRRYGITIVLITHEMNVIKSICDRVAVMSGGRVVETGDVFDIFAHPQHAFTQQLVSHTLNLTLPERLRQHLPGQLLKILFIGDSAEQPVLSDAAIKFGVAVNILHGKIEYLGERALGILVVQLTAPENPDVVDAAVDYIRNRTARVEVIRG